VDEKMANTPKKIFSDIDLDFTPNPFTKDISIKYDEDSVKRSIRNLILTGKNERLFQPEIYSGIKELLFQNFGSVQIVTLQSRLEEMLIISEPRITEVSVEVVENVLDQVLEIDISFSVRGVPDLQRLTLEIERVR
jgi:phage baseplate assembly protein W